MDTIENLSDQAILMQAAKDHSYLAVLVKRYRTPLFNFAYRFVGLRETAEDIVQETFLRCLKHSHKCPPIQHVSTWLYTIAGNLAKTELRRRKRWHSIPIEPSEDSETTSFFEPVDKAPLPDAKTDTWMAHHAIVQAIERLPEEFREAVLLRDMSGLSYEEIARIARCPIGTIKSRVNRGRIRLQKDLLLLGEEVIGALSHGTD